MISTSKLGDHQEWTPKEFALTRGSRQIYAETALLPYSLNCFTFACWLDRDNWAARRNYAQLHAVRTIEIMNAYLVDGINGTHMGECDHGGRGHMCGLILSDRTAPGRLGRIYYPPRQLLPISVLFPKPRKIVVVEEHERVESKLTEMAQLAGATDWKAFVKMRERSEVEVVAMPHF